MTKILLVATFLVLLTLYVLFTPIRLAVARSRR